MPNQSSQPLLKDAKIPIRYMLSSFFHSKLSPVFSVPHPIRFQIYIEAGILIFCLRRVTYKLAEESRTVFRPLTVFSPVRCCSALHLITPVFMHVESSLASSFVPLSPAPTVQCHPFKVPRRLLLCQDRASFIPINQPMASVSSFSSPCPFPVTPWN